MAETRSVLVIAGLDPSGGAGLLADVATAWARGVHAAGVVTALTVQDSARCHAWEPVDPGMVDRQIEVLVEDLAIAAVKVGMLGTRQMAQAVARALGGLVSRGVPVVVDPVLNASVGTPLADGEASEVMAPLLALATLLTPNRMEAEALSGLVVDGADDQLRAARALRQLGPAAVLLKGGHVGEAAGGAEVVDLLDDGEAEPLRLTAPRRPGPTPHGLGCALATEIAAGMALGLGLREAVRTAHARTAERIRRAWLPGHGRPFLGRATEPA